MKKIVILISGTGSNMRNIVEYFHTKNLAKVCAVISNKSEALGLVWAKEKKINTHIIEHKSYKIREEFDKKLLECVKKYDPDIVVLAGFMRILTDVFINPLLGKLINIHPSLLPKFKGLNTHACALEEKVLIHGASVHFVTAELDSGPIILQAGITVSSKDNEESLAKKVLKIEHFIYPKAIQMLIDKEVILE